MEKRFLYTLLIIVMVITLIIIYPFLTVFILAGSFTIILEPIYFWINKHLTPNSPGMASFVTLILFLILLCIPLFFIGTVIFNQTQSAYHSVLSNGGASTFIQTLDRSINNFMPSGFTFNTYERITQLFSFLSNNVGSFFTATFNTLLMFILTLVTIFFLLRNGQEWKNGLIKLLPLSDKNVEQILKSIKASITRILRGTFVIAIIQGVMSWIGFKIFGVPSPALWGVIAGIASFVPNIGIFLISGPAILFLYFTGMHIHAFGLFIWSFALVGTIINFLTPYLISKNSDIPPLFIMFAMLGGITLLGPIGILIGPIVLSLLYSLVSIYKKESKID